MPLELTTVSISIGDIIFNVLKFKGSQLTAKGYCIEIGIFESQYDIVPLYPLTHVTVSIVLFKVDGVLKFSNSSVKRLTIAITKAPFFVIT